MRWTGKAAAICVGAAMWAAAAAQAGRRSQAAAQERPVLRYVPKHEELKYTYRRSSAGSPRGTGDADHHVDRGLL